MPAIFSKNCILKGDIDAFCLVCSTHLPEDEDVLAHIQNSNHKESLTSIAYYEKFKDDFIRKVKAVYFCEVCSKTFATAAKVGIHVTEESHIQGRRRQLTRVGTSIVFQKNTVIGESAWNGLVEDACVLCNIEFDDYSTHVSEPNHILNVIRSTVTIDSDNNIYRNVDGGYHCLICNKIVAQNCIMEHLKSTEHKNAIVKDDISQHTDNNEINAEVNIDKKIKKTEGNGDLVKEESKTKTLTSKTLSIDGKISSSKPLLTKDKEKPASSKSITQETETFAKKHGLTVNKFNYTVHCTVCISQIPAIMTCVKEHVSGKKHKENSLKLSFKSQHNKKIIINTKDFIKRVDRVVHLQGTFLIINQQFCLKFGDFFGFAEFCGKLVCTFCHIDLNPEYCGAHIKSKQHKKLMENSFVVTSLENEFVRQVKSDLYHCGYCGQVESEFDEMMDHLATTRHKMRRAEGEKMIQHLEMEEFIRFNNFLAFLANF